MGGFRCALYRRLDGVDPLDSGGGLTVVVVVTIDDDDEALCTPLSLLLAKLGYAFPAKLVSGSQLANEVRLELREDDPGVDSNSELWLDEHNSPSPPPVVVVAISPSRFRISLKEIALPLVPLDALALKDPFPLA